MLVLGIETSCDETSVAIVEDGKKILSNVIAYQTDVHSKYGGVYPELAFREHINAVIPTLEKALNTANIPLESIDVIAVTQGPGLIGALLVGLNVAKSLSFSLNKPLVGINHIEAHIYSAIMNDPNPTFPALGLVVSGGHTFLVKIKEIGSYELIGTTLDDAAGEAFDKVAKILGLPYPGGPELEKLAHLGNPKKYAFTAGKIKGRPLDFSFSGIKTSVLYAAKGENAKKDDLCLLSQEEKADIAASFQKAVLQDIYKKTLKASQIFEPTAIYIGGGVSNNMRFREIFKDLQLPVFWPCQGLSSDNAAMIAGLGFHIFSKKSSPDPLSIEPLHRVPLST